MFKGDHVPAQPFTATEKSINGNDRIEKCPLKNRIKTRIDWMCKKRSSWLLFFAGTRTTLPGWTDGRTTRTARRWPKCNTSIGWPNSECARNWAKKKTSSLWLRTQNSTPNSNCSSPSGVAAAVCNGSSVNTTRKFIVSVIIVNTVF